MYYEKTKDYAQLRAIKPWQGRGQQMELSGAGNAAESTLHWAKRGALGKEDYTGQRGTQYAESKTVHCTVCKEEHNMQRARLGRRSTLGKEEHTRQGGAHWASKSTLGKEENNMQRVRMGKEEYTRHGGAHWASRSTICRE